jgi:putative two-component system response regulator
MDRRIQKGEGVILWRLRTQSYPGSKADKGNGDARKRGDQESFRHFETSLVHFILLADAVSADKKTSKSIMAMNHVRTIRAEQLITVIREYAPGGGNGNSRAATILLGDGLAANPVFTTNVLANEAYQVVWAETAAQLFEKLTGTPVDLVILPASSSSLPGLDCCRRIKADRKTELVPVLVVTDSGIESQIDALSAGADDFLPLPIHPDLARTRIRALLRQKAATDRLEQTEVILFTLAKAVEHRDNTTGGHCDRLGLVSLALGLALGLGERDLEALYRGGFLHDIGKVGMPDRILHKPGPLDEEEWQTMRTHPERGEEICKPLRSLEPVLPIIRSHHERWDGSGYPDGLVGDRIPLLARVLQLADIFDALTNARPYKEAMTDNDALLLMQQETDRGWRDPELMHIFTCLHREALSSGPWREARAMQDSLRNLQAHLVQA